MKKINRYAFIVRPKKPFLDWANYTDPNHPMTLDEIRDEPDVYLLPEIRDRNISGLRPLVRCKAPAYKSAGFKNGSK